jgi:hypothetical protein
LSEECSGRRETGKAEQSGDYQRVEYDQENLLGGWKKLKRNCAILRRKGRFAMVDIPIDPGTSVQWRPRLNSPSITLALRVAFLLATFVLLAWSWSAVATEYAEKRCDSTLGKLAVRFKLDSYYSNCQCMTHSLDFSDACNSIYIPLLLW